MRGGGGDICLREIRLFSWPQAEPPTPQKKGEKKQKARAWLMQVHAGSQVAMASVSQLQSSKNAREEWGGGEAKHQHVNSEGSLTGRTVRDSNRGVLHAARAS